MNRLLTVLVLGYAIACGSSVPPEPAPCETNMPLSADFQGVWTNPNAHSKVPNGAARYAHNVVNPGPGVASCVAGQENLAGTYSAADERLSTGLTYDGYLIESTNGATDKLYRRDPDDPAGVTAYSGSYTPPSGVVRLPMAIAGERLYVATTAGLQMLDGSAAATFEAAELPPPLYISAAPGAGTLFSGAGTAASGTVTLAGGAGDVTIVVNGISVGPIAFNTDDATTAADCVTALNANGAFALVATAASDGPVITITWDTVGTGGNQASLSATRTAGSATASGAFLTGGTGESVAYRYTIARRLSDGTYRRGIPSGRLVYESQLGSEDVELTLELPDGLEATDRIEVWRSGIAEPGTDPNDTLFLVAQVNPDSNVLNGITQAQAITDATPDTLRGEPLYTNAAYGGLGRQNERPPIAKEITAFDDFLIMANVKGPERFTFRLIGNLDNNDTITIDGVTYTGKTGAAVLANNEFSIYTGGATVAENIEGTAQGLILTINDWLGRNPARGVHAYYLSGPLDPPGIIAIEAREVSKTTFTVQAGNNGDRYEPPLDTAQSSLAVTEENGIWFSKRGEHYSFPPLRSAGTGATYRIRVGNTGRPILKLAKLRSSLIAFVSQEGVWKIQRVGAESWRVDQINNNAHLLVPDSVAVVDNQVIAFTTRGIIAVDDTGVEEIDLPIKDQIQNIRNLGPDVVVPNTFAVADEGRLRYILYHPETTSDTYATHAWVYNAEHGTWTERTDPASGGFVGEDDGLLYLGSATSNVLTRERTGTAAQVYQRPDGTAIPVRLELTVQDEGAPSLYKQYTDFVLLTKERITGSATFNFTNDLGGTASTTGSTSASGEPYIHVWVPDGVQRTTRLTVDIRRNVLGQAFDVVGTQLWPAGTYKGGMLR